MSRSKLEVCRSFRVRPPSNSELIQLLKGDERRKLLPVLKLKPVRTGSGVVVITVMTKPWPCPKAEPCIYCPGGPALGTPQSYTGREPAAMRGLQHEFDPYRQVTSRIRQLREMGHDVDKVELIILGGTSMALPMDYLTYFVKRCLDGLNGAEAGSIEDAKRLAETSRVRNSDITIETRPDWGQRSHVDQMLNLGITKVEFGVQTIYDEIYRLVNRGHSIQDVVDSFQVARDAGLGIGAHMMPGLPGSSYERDLEAFRALFEDDRFRPDALKIYPTLVLEGTKLFDLWRKGEYVPLSTDQLVEMIARVKRDHIPEYVRVKRVMRDIPSHLIVDGPRISNLREAVWDRLDKMGGRCRCVRCREVGHVMERLGQQPRIEDVKLRVRLYEASGGTELFLSYEDVRMDILVAFLRLRIPSEHAHRDEVKEKPSALVRELHVYGPLVRVGEQPKTSDWQHRGYGRALLQRAEEIARDQFDAERLLITSGLGVKSYYHSLGFGPCGPYMGKPTIPLSPS